MLDDRTRDCWDAARDLLEMVNRDLVVKIAREYAGRGLCFQDLVEEGNLGLRHAVDEFDPSRKTRFGTYADVWIRQSIEQALLSRTQSIGLPAYVVDLLSRWRRAVAELKDELGRIPTAEELVRELKLTPKKAQILGKYLLQTRRKLEIRPDRCRADGIDRRYS